MSYDVNDLTEITNFINKASFTVCDYYVTYEFQSESTLYSLPECQGTQVGAVSEV